MSGSQSSPAESNPRWAQVLQRDRDADGRFVYAVTTTGVFCRPSCPSRRPRIENTRFFDVPAQAVAAGFRPCRRCQPLRTGIADPSALHADHIAMACRRLESEEPQPDLQTLADAAGMSPGHFQRTFKRLLGVSPKRYADTQRARRLGRHLQSGMNVTDAVYEAGYGSASRAYQAAQAHLGMTPGSYANKGAGESIRYACAPCSLGQVLVAGTEKGICAIELDDTIAALEARLRARFGNARLSPAGADFETWLTTVVGFIDDPHAASDDALRALPLDIRGSAFQQRVWQALRELPPGRTLTYAELAERIGRPGAARAVANACASNRIAVVIPCHRIIRGDGSLSGYRWGPQRKHALLEREAHGGAAAER